MRKEFKIGDIVKRSHSSWGEMKVGDTDEIVGFNAMGYINLKRYGMGHSRINCELVETVKETKMKKFKNRLAVIGSIPLLKAFAEELDYLGHTRDKGTFGDFNEKGKQTILVYTEASDRYTYGVYNHTGDINFKTINLPKDWELGLKLAAEVEEEVLKPEVGKWYKLTIHPKSLFYCTSVNTRGSVYGYGFGMNGDWIEALVDNGRTCMCNNTSFENVVLATNEEVETALINEAKKRYPIGTYLTCLINWHKNQKLYSNQNKFDLEYKHNQLWEKSAHMHYCVFQNGQWAEIVPNEVKVNGYVITKINDSSVKVGCKMFDIKWLDGLYNFIYYYNGEYIASDGSKWTGSDISKIIDAFNKM